MNRQYQQAHARYPGIPSAAMRARHPEMSVAALTFCCLVAEIVRDLCTAKAARLAAQDAAGISRPTAQKYHAKFTAEDMASSQNDQAAQ